MMTPRKEAILKYVVETYIRDAEPIGSKLMSENAALEVSGATLRNEMRELEEEGLLTHPHTSSGRIPTEKGYRYYIEHLMKPEIIAKRTAEKIAHSLREYRDREQKLKMFARIVSELCGSAVVISFEKNSLYYTGISHFFAQPEFQDYEFTVTMSGMFDSFEDLIPELYDGYIGTDPHIVIGSESPFGHMSGVVGGRLKGEEFFAILGPLRMRYNRAISLITYGRDLL
ncbi:MAG: hypothetical protein KBD29_01425 [Candidatus Magasanikbacteria bacterium]|nr:hypothetical protein [Candidatus Magasanikbacteria bacterium]